MPTRSARGTGSYKVHARPARVRRRGGGRAVAGLWRALALTVVSGLVWGIAHLYAGRRVAGVLLMTLYGAVLGGAAVLAAAFHQDVRRIAVQQSALAAIALGILVLAATWAAVVLRSYAVVRPAGLPAAMRLTAGALVVMITMLGCAPLVYAANATYVLRGTLGAIFDGDGRGTPVDADDPWRGKPRLNVLLLGGDGGANRTGIRTDSVTVASIDTRTGETVLMGLPRGLQRFEMPARLRARWPAGYTGDPGDQGLLNELYIMGERHPELTPGQRRGERGPRLLEEVVGHLLGMKIDYYVLVNLAGFADIVDAMGGVVVNVPKRLPIGGDKDPRNPRPPVGFIEPGRQKLNGEEALWFGRSRYADDDFQRMDRQKCLLKDIAQQADARTLLTRIERLAKAAKNTISTNIPAALLPALAELSDTVKQGAALRSLAFNPTTMRGFQVFRPNVALMRAQAAKAIAKPPKPRTPATRATTPTPAAKRRTAPATSGPVSLGAVCGR